MALYDIELIRDDPVRLAEIDFNDLTNEDRTILTEIDPAQLISGTKFFQVDYHFTRDFLVVSKAGIEVRIPTACLYYVAIEESSSYDDELAAMLEETVNESD